MKRKIFLFCAILLITCTQLMAQPFNLNEAVQPVELNFTEYKKEGEDKAKGRISMNTLTQDKDTMYYFIKGMSMYSPSYFSLNSSDPSADIKVNLCKENWHSFHHTGEVKGKSIWSKRFKNEGDIGIMVISRKKPVRYVLLVWTGDEMKIEIPSVFKTADGASLSGGGWFAKNKTILIIAVIVFALGLLLFFKLKKRPMNKTLLLLAFLCLSVSANAQDQNEPVIQGNEAQSSGNEDQREEEASDREAIDGAIQNLQDYMNWLEDRRNEWNTIQNFSPSDCAPDFGASGQAMMPSSCANNQACGECYERAVGELNFIRRQLGRLSCIYGNTKRFNESALAFGDNMSGIHAVTGAAWQSSRGEIVAAFESFKHSYDNKYTGMMGSLQQALQSIGTCEAQYGLPDWYQRFGFIYFEFMKDKYKRVD